MFYIHTAFSAKLTAWMRTLFLFSVLYVDRLDVVGHAIGDRHDTIVDEKDEHSDKEADENDRPDDGRDFETRRFHGDRFIVKAEIDEEEHGSEPGGPGDSFPESVRHKGEIVLKNNKGRRLIFEDLVEIVEKVRDKDQKDQRHGAADDGS